VAVEAKRGDALQFIFSFFLGLLLVVFVGVGVWTFYPQPFGQNSPEQRQLDKLYREQGQGKEGVTAGGVSSAEFERIQKKIDALNDKMQKERDRWAVNTSIILLAFATILMAISLFLPDHMKVFSNGVLLGGVFSVIYGTGWSFAGGDSRARFYVVTAALVLSIAIGYLRFISDRRDRAAAKAAVATTQGAAATDAAAAASANEPALAELAGRVAALERRSAAVAAALSADEGERD